MRVLAVVVLDQATKELANRFLAGRPSFEILDGWVRLTYHENKGAAFGILQDSAIFLTFFSLALGGLLAFYLFRFSPKGASGAALGLILGGAIGNTIDRLRIGAVVDFVDLTVWPIFNLADSAITLGVLILAFQAIIKRKKRLANP